MASPSGGVRYLIRSIAAAVGLFCRCFLDYFVFFGVAVMAFARAYDAWQEVEKHGWKWLRRGILTERASRSGRRSLIALRDKRRNEPCRFEEQGGGDMENVNGIAFPLY